MRFIDKERKRIEIEAEHGERFGLSAAGVSFGGIISLEQFLLRGGAIREVEPWAPYNGDLKEAQRQLIEAVDERAGTLLDSISGGINAAQRALYDRKYARAKAEVFDAAFVDEAKARGVSPKDWAAIVIKKYEDAVAIGDAIETAKATHKGRIDKIKDVQQAARYDVSLGWPL